MNDPDPSLWLRALDAFDAMVDLAPAERGAALVVLARESPSLAVQVQGLLDADSHAGDDDAQGCASAASAGCAGAAADPSPDADPRPEFVPEWPRVPGFRVLGVLGKGGMGEVFLAERETEDFVQRVALKRITLGKSDASLHERFLRERRILAQLNHPNIARLLDGGIDADGNPYFAMELVEGTSLIQYARENELDLRARLRLFIVVCEAVAYAQINLIVHRDLKPSNVLVDTTGQVKLLDFGIAKLLAPGDDQATATLAMTPAYAAPEQLLGEAISTATDVYALGLLLFELLVGNLPERSWRERMRDAVSEQNSIERPSSGVLQARIGANPNVTIDLRQRRRLAQQLRGDLDQIVLLALRRDPSRRYPTAQALADDLARFLEGRPVRARADHWQYRLEKLVRRNAWAMAAAGLTFAGLIAATIISLSFASSERAARAVADAERGKAEQQAERARREVETTAAVKEFLLGLFAAVDPNQSKGENLTARDLLDRGARRIETQLGSQPGLRAELKAVLGGVYYQLGFYREAQALQESAIDLAGRERPLLAAESRHQLARTLLALDQRDRATELARQAHAELLAAGAPPDALVRALLTQAAIATRTGRYEQESEFAHQALELARASKLGSATLGNALAAEGRAAWNRFDLPASVRHYREALQAHLAAYGELDLRVANDRADLTLALRNVGHYDEALEQLEQALRVRERLLGPRHAVVASSLQSLGTMHYHFAHYDGAEQRLRAAIALQRELLGETSAALPNAMNSLGLVLQDRGKLDEAERVFVQALSISKLSRGDDHPDYGLLAGNLVVVHTRQGKLESAEREARELLAWEKEHKIPPDSFDLNRLGDIRRLRGDWRDAVQLHRQAVDLATRSTGEISRSTALSRYYLGLALAAGGEHDNAATELRASLASFAGFIPGARHPHAASARIALAELLLQRAPTRVEGVTLLREAVAIREEFLDAGDPRIREAREALGKASGR